MLYWFCATHYRGTTHDGLTFHGYWWQNPYYFSWGNHFHPPFILLISFSCSNSNLKTSSMDTDKFPRYFLEATPSLTSFRSLLFLIQTVFFWKQSHHSSLTLYWQNPSLLLKQPLPSLLKLTSFSVLPDSFISSYKPNISLKTTTLLPYCLLD